jgi:hypothetical protein
VAAPRHPQTGCRSTTASTTGYGADCRSTSGYRTSTGSYGTGGVRRDAA